MYIGRYLRKRGNNGVYQPDDGWHRKWTYKVCWFGSGENISLVAMTDGMTTKELTKTELLHWIIDNDMVLMKKPEMIEFMECEHDESGNFTLRKDID